MVFPALPHFALAASMVCMAAPAGAAEASSLLGLDIQGGSQDDVAYARVAAGLADRAPVTDAAFQSALAAIRLTDRFRRVEGQLVPGPDGVRAQVRLDPWPAIQRLEWRGDLHREGVKRHIHGMRAGMRPGEQRLAAWSRELQGRLVEALHSGLKRLPRAVEQLRINPNTSIAELLNPPAQPVNSQSSTFPQHIQKDIFEKFVLLFKAPKSNQR